MKRSRIYLPLFLLLVFLGTPRLHSQEFKDCTLTSLGKVPLNDLGPRLYQGFPGGLYPGGSNSPPASFRAVALERGRQWIRPRDAAGQIDEQNGRIALISIGMSNTTREFATAKRGFKPQADNDPSVNPRLVIVDGAQGGHGTKEWMDPSNEAWTILAERLESAGVSPPQVQVAWVKLVERIRDLPDRGFPNHAQELQARNAQVIRLLKENYPNIAIAYLSSRTRAYTLSLDRVNPEPFAYETGFAIKWMIENQIDGTGDLNYDPALGPVRAPLLLWGPYLWADGLNPRSDGFTWECQDVVNDGIHPSGTGIAKVAAHLLSFFKTDPTTQPWFLRPSTGQLSVEILPSVTSGQASLNVRFQSNLSGAGPEVSYSWNFDDGGFSQAANPNKVFPVPGDYSVTLAVSDSSGNQSTRSVVISVSSSAEIPDPDTPPSSNVFYFPLVGDGVAGAIRFQTRLIFFNTGDSPATVEVSFFDQQGVPLPMPFQGVVDSNLVINLPGGGSYSAQTSGIPPDPGGGLLVGYARVRTTEQVDGQVIFIRSDVPTGVVLYIAAVKSSLPISQFTFFVDTSDVYDAGVALVNPITAGEPNPRSVNVTLRFLDEQFELLATREIELMPGHAMSRFVGAELFPSLGERIGVITAVSDGPVAVLALLIREGAPFPLDVPNLAPLPLRAEVAQP